MQSKPKNKQFVSLLSSDEEPSLVSKSSDNYKLSEHFSSVSLQKKQIPAKISTNCMTQHMKTQQRISYEDVCGFKSFKESTTLMTHFYSLRQFLEKAGKNVLFVFGPTGCGKRLLIETSLKSSEISYEWARGRLNENEYGQHIQEDMFEVFYRELGSRSMTLQKVVLFADFPSLTEESPSSLREKYKAFKSKVYETIRDSKNLNKYIFLLNNQIYNPFYVLSESSQEKALKNLGNVSVIKMEAYGKREMKAIIEHFLKVYPAYHSAINGAKEMEQVIVEAEGDARKALNLIYYRKTMQDNRKSSSYLNKAKNSSQGLMGQSQKREYKPNDEVQQQKVSIFHMLGKFLYAKRFNIYYNPHLKGKKDNDISAFYTEEQIMKYDPKFYFRPVPMLDRSRLELAKFRDLLEENFLSRYGKVSDVAKMYDIFRFEDSYLEDGSNRPWIRREMEEYIKQLLTWGIILCNKNSVRPRASVPFQRSRNPQVQKTLQKKLSVVRSNYLKRDLPTLGYNYRLADLLQFAFRTKTERPRNDYGFMHQKLIEVVFDSRKSVKASEGMALDGNVMQGEEEEEMAQQGCDRINQLEREINAELRKQAFYMQLMEQSEDSEQEEEDIDSD